MQIRETASSLFFESEELSQEVVIDVLSFFIDRLEKIGCRLDALYPGDPFSLPFLMFLSDKLSVPIKTEQFLSADEKVLVVFSFLPLKGVSERYVARKLKVFRGRFPNSPSLLIASDEKVDFVDFQLLKAPLEKVFSYRFLAEGERNFFYPLEGEFTHFSQEFWELSKKELSHFLRAKRIRDSARKYLKEEDLERLKVVDSDLDLALWERFEKGILTFPSLREETDEEFVLRVEKLFQIEDKVLSSAVTSVLEYLAQGLEYKFPTYLAYSNVEVSEREGVLIIPRAVQELDGVDLRIEVVVRLKNIDRSFREVRDLLLKSLSELMEEMFKRKGFKPSVDSVVESELGKATIYLNWFIDSEMARKLYKKINRRWLMTRLLYRKRIKSEVSEALKLLKEFVFTPDNFELLFSKLEHIWKVNPVFLKMKKREIKSVLDERKLWPIVGVYGLKLMGSVKSLKKELLSFLLSLKGYENIHHFFAEELRFFLPVKTKRIYRPNWERVIREKEEVVLKEEPLNPNSPVTFVLQSRSGKFLGTLPETVSHYLAARKASGYKLSCRELYFDPAIFSENSYWIEVECLSL